MHFNTVHLYNTLTNNCIACLTAAVTSTKIGLGDREPSVICIQYRFEWTLEFVVYFNRFCQINVKCRCLKPEQFWRFFDDIFIICEQL